MLSLITLNNIEDYFKVKSQRNPLGVFFYRVIGYDDELLLFLRKYQTYAQKKGAYVNKTINNPDSSDIRYLATLINPNFTLNINNIKTDCENWLKFLNVNQIDVVCQAIYETLSEMKKTGLNDSILKNSYIKFLYWMKYKFENAVKYINQDEIPKILYEGDITKYELYMLRILSLAGCDIIYINFLNENSYLKIDKNSKFSMKIEKSIRKTPETHFSKIDLRQIEEKNKILHSIKTAPYKLNTNIWIKEDFLIEILKPNADRCEKKSDVNNAFIQYIGIDNKEEYNNRLFFLKEKLNQNKKRYIIIENGVPEPTLDEIAKYRFQYKSKDDIIYNIIKNINVCNENKINQSIKNEIVTIIQNMQEKNLAKIYNVSVKLLCWIERYSKKLFFKVDWNFLPVIIEFGNIDNIEASFLCIMSKLPVDIIYINPNKENIKVFNNVIGQNNGKIVELVNDYKEKTTYPSNEVKLRTSTVAYNAEQELNNILYQDTGLYRTKQFKTCKAITLKTSFEEIAILWKEEAKYRPGFKIEENNVIVPNIFSKVCGVKDSDVVTYCKNMQELVTEQTIFIKGFPYIRKETYNIFYNKSNKFIYKDKFDKEAAKNLKEYKYNFLNNNTQELIFMKIQEMINLKLIEPNDPSINQKIASTLLNIDNEILKQIQNFDFTKQIPKIIITDVDENIASLQDCILILFLNLIGFDIIIFTPTGFQNIEKYININLYEEYQIGDYIYNLKVPKLKKVEKKRNSFLKNLFKRGN